MLPSLAPELHTPERLPFVRKLRNFMADHGLDEVPTLIFQCAPLEIQAADLKVPGLQHVLLNGAGESADGDWWGGFMGGATSNVFDGIAAVSERQEPRWITELHHDGHVFAGIRLLVPPDAKGVPDIIEVAFHHFALLVERLHAAVGISGTMLLTASLVNSKGLRLLKPHSFGRPSARELRRDTLEWPVHIAKDAVAFKMACGDMREQMRRAFP